MARNKINRRKENFIKGCSRCDLETSDINKRCLFNLSYFSPANGGQDFKDWAKIENGSTTLNSLLTKMVEFSKEPLSYWEEQRVGGGGRKVLTYYSKFPENTLFKKPASIPHDVRWGRFRLSGKARLVGFSVPSSLTMQDDKGRYFNTNIFYIVFLDKDHEFWAT